MSVEFNEEKNFGQQLYGRNAGSGASSGASGITAWIIKRGWAKNESVANGLMIVVTIVCFAVAIFFIIK